MKEKNQDKELIEEMLQNNEPDNIDDDEDDYGGDNYEDYEDDSMDDDMMGQEWRYDSSVNPWLDVYGPGDEAESAYWNTE